MLINIIKGMFLAETKNKLTNNQEIHMLHMHSFGTLLTLVTRYHTKSVQSNLS